MSTSAMSPPFAVQRLHVRGHPVASFNRGRHTGHHLLVVGHAHVILCERNTIAHTAQQLFLVSFAPVLNRPLEHLQLPVSCRDTHVSSSHGQPRSRAHRSISRFPFAAALCAGHRVPREVVIVQPFELPPGDRPKRLSRTCQDPTAQRVHHTRQWSTRGGTRERARVPRAALL